MQKKLFLCSLSYLRAFLAFDCIVSALILSISNLIRQSCEFSLSLYRSQFCESHRCVFSFVTSHLCNRPLSLANHAQSSLSFSSVRENRLLSSETSQ